MDFHNFPPLLPLNQTFSSFGTLHRERRTEFEEFLTEERKKMELFRLREIKEFLSLDELKEKCDTADQHMTMLEVCLNNQPNDVCATTIRH